MSDTPQGPGWWKASDGKWYAPEQHPDYQVGSQTPSASEPAVTPEPSGTPTPPATASPPAGGSPSTPPADPAATPKGNSSKTKLIIGIVAAIAVIAAGFVLVNVLGDDKASADGVTLTPLGASDSAAFTDSFAAEATGSLRAFAESGAPIRDENGGGTQTSEDGAIDRKAGYKSISGDVPGLYGGTLDELSCDVDQLGTFLAEDEEKAAAFAGVLALDPANLEAYLDQLTPVNLGSDTRVLSHGYQNGAATTSEAVLQRGSAVLVDARGVPRVNCYGGNPLLPPSLTEDEKFNGEKWGSFDPAEVVAVEESPTTLDEFDLVNVETGEMFTRKVGKGRANQSSDRPAQTGRPIDGAIELNREYNDRLEDDRTEARYTFEVPDSGVVTFTLVNDRESTSRVRVEILNQGSRILDERISANDATEWIMVLDHEGGSEFELLITEGPAVYDFELAFELQNDGGQKGDAGNDFDTAFEIPVAQTVKGRLGNFDDRDAYIVELPPGAEVRFKPEIPRGSSRARFEIYFEGSRIYDARVNPAANTDWSLLFPDEESGFLEIYVSETDGEYTFTLDAVVQQDGGQKGDAPGELANAREISVGEELTGQVGGRDGGDYYLFEVSAPTMRFEIANAVTSPERLRYEIYTESGSRLTDSRVNPGATSEYEFPAEAGQQYRLYISEGRADYTFQLNAVGE